MKTIGVRIRGTQPLLQHKMSSTEEAQMKSKVKQSIGQKKGDNPEDYLYLHEGIICQPSEHIYQAIVKRMSGYKIQGQGKKTYKDMAKGCITIFPEFIPHENPNWVVDERTVVIPSTKGRIMRKRPRFNEWSLTFTIKVINDFMPAEVIKSALEDAGREGGIGDYRPRYGLFEVTHFHERD
jgi:hypothetical protein